jgi:hypothetical protein
MDEDKVKTVRNWSREEKTENGQLNNLVEVKQFLGLSIYYRRLITKYSDKAEPVMRLMKKEEAFVWEPEQQLACEAMVTAFTTAPALRHFDDEREVIIETDVCDYVSAGV